MTLSSLYIHPALNAGFIALTWAFAHASLLSSIAGQGANKNPKTINDILKSCKCT